MDSSSNKKLRIAIVGGGIGGLTCAIALKNRTDAEIDLYESAARLTEIGAGITVWPRTWKIFKSMGLEEDVASISLEQPKDEKELVWTFRKSDQQEGFNIFELYENGNGLSVHRQDMQRVLLNHLPPFCKVHLKHRLDRYEEVEDHVKLYFQNGTVSTHDVVIGADGVKSAVRRTLLAQSSALKNHDDNGIYYTGTMCYRGLISKEKLESVWPECQALQTHITYCGKLNHIVASPISKETIINVVAFYSNPADAGKPSKTLRSGDVTIDEILKQYSGWEDGVMRLLSAMQHPVSWPIQQLVPLEKYVSNRMALVGDAAHAMSPHLGAGAGVAIEDAYFLGTLFSKSSCRAEDVPRILDIYNTFRRPHGNDKIKSAYDMNDHYEFLLPEYEGVKDSMTPEQMTFFGDAIVKAYAWGWGKPEIEMERAVEML